MHAHIKPKFNHKPAKIHDTVTVVALGEAGRGNSNIGVLVYEMCEQAYMCPRGIINVAKSFKQGKYYSKSIGISCHKSLNIAECLSSFEIQEKPTK